MKKSLNLAIAMLVAAIMMAITAQVVTAADLILDTEIQSMAIANDKNGNEYVRFIIQEEKSLNGVSYTADTVVMCFGSAVAKAKTFSEGDTLKAIASQNEYRGRMNYNILAFVQ